MRLGCMFSVVFAVAALIIFALLAPLLFHGADMVALGRLALGPVVVVFGSIGFAVGYLVQRHRERP